MLTIKNRVGNSYIIFLALVITFLTGCTPAGPRALLAGKRLMEQGKYPQAIERLKTAATSMKTNALAWSYLGLAYQYAGQAPDAERAYLQALALNRELAEVNYDLGCLYLAQNRPDAAKAPLTAFTFRRPDSADGFIKLGLAQVRLRELNAAERSFSEALRLHPQSAEALNGLGLSHLQRGQYREAMAYFGNASKNEPNYRPALLNQAIVAHLYLRDRPLALQKYRAYLALKPTPPDAQAVATLERQLQQELTPPPRSAVTNALVSPAPVVSPQAVTNAPRLAVSNAPPVRVVGIPKPEPATNSVPKPAPPVSQVASQTKPLPAPPVAQAVPAPAPAPKTEAPKPAKVEVVKLPPEPVAKAVHESPAPTTPAPVPRPTAQVAAATAPPPVRPPPPATTPPPAAPVPQASTSSPLVTTSSLPTSVASAKTAKRGILHTMNPLNLLRADEKPAPRLTPLPALPAEVVSSAAEPATNPAAPVPSVPRYTYQSPTRPVAGNRAGAEPPFAQGLKAQEERHFTEAIQSYRTATQADPGFFEAYYNLGLAGTAASNLPVALAAYETALAIQPDSPEARYNFGLALQQANFPLDAANELEKIVARRPNETRVHLVLGNLYAQPLRQPAKAREHYAKVLELEPRHPQAGPIRFWLGANPP